MTTSRSGKLSLLVFLGLAASLGACAGTSDDAPAAQSSEDEFIGRPTPSGDCSIERTRTEDTVRVRIDYLGEDAPELGWFAFELPASDLPLRDRFEATIDGVSSSDHTKVTYEDGELRVVDRAASNHTTDTLVLTSDPDLAAPTKATFERKVDLWLRPFGGGSKFACTGWTTK
jgi:hypothetical protein